MSKRKGHCLFLDFLFPAGWNPYMMAGSSAVILDNAVTLKLVELHDGVTRSKVPASLILWHAVSALG